MILDLREIFAGGKPLHIDSDLSLTDYEINGENPISELHFTGDVINRADVVSLSGKASFVYSAPCDRCAEPTVRKYCYDISHVLVNRLENEDDFEDDAVLTENMQLDLDDLIRSDIILLLPAKFLCKEDCKGICPGCGKRLNFEECVCKKEIDPRLAKLSDFFDE